MTYADDLKAIRERCEKATEGPWFGDDGHVHSRPLSDKATAWVLQKVETGRDPGFERPEHEVAHCSQELPNFENDERFIAHARTDVERLERFCRALAEVVIELVDDRSFGETDKSGGEAVVDNMWDESEGG